MLEEMRRNSRSTIIYVLFGMLIVVFILSFGPSAGRGGGCSPPSSFVVKVNGVVVSENSWRAAMIGSRLGEGATMRQRLARARETVMDKLIERELLAQAAAKAGFTLSTAEVEARIGKGEFYILGEAWPGQIIYFDEDGSFDYARLEEYAKGLQLGSVGGFIEEQKKEMQAHKMRELIRAGVRVSPDEVLERYNRERSSVQIEYVKYLPRSYRKLVNLSDADLDAWVGQNEADVKAKYESDKNLYSGEGKWAQVRLVFVKRERPDPQDPLGEGVVDGAAKPDAGAAAPTDAPALPDPGLAKAKAVESRLKAGEAFDKVAREVSADERTAPRGGLQEWRRVTALGWGTEVQSAVEALKPGDASAVIEISRGFVIVKLEAMSDAAPTYEQLRRDLGWDLARDAKTKALAKADAEAAFAKLGAGTPLDQLFQKGSPDGDDVDEPTTPPAPAPAAPPTPGATPPTPGATGASGQAPAGGGPGAGSRSPVGAGRPAPATTPPPPAVPAPKLVPSGPLQRKGAVVSGSGGERYIGRSAELAKAIFDEVGEGQLAKKVYEVDDGFVIFRVTEKSEPDMDAFEKEKAGLTERMADEKATALITAWLDKRCGEVKTAGAIEVTSLYVEYGDVDEKSGLKRPTLYQPCAGGANLLGAGLPPGMTFE
jgi:peptidyl-prolyl cis-trans isomerase D